MAEKVEKELLEKFNDLSFEDQEKILKKLEKNKKPKPLGALPSKEPTGATEGWG